MEIIQSKDNKKVKEARKLLTKKYRKTSYLIEGFHLLEEAVKAGAEIKQIFVEEGKLDKISSVLTGLSVTIVSADVLKSLTDTGSPQGVVAEIAKSEATDFDVKKVLILEDVQDPGNVGTMIRTADAAGFDAVFTTTDTADIYSPKVMRSMQGSHFHLPVIDGMPIEEIFAIMKDAQLELLVTTLSEKSVSHKTVNVEKFALVMGNEGNGVSEFASSHADQLVHIDMAGQAESLNVAVAAGVLMFSL